MANKTSFVILLIAYVTVLSLDLAAGAADDFQVSVDADGSYRVVVAGRQWLRSAPTFFTAEGIHYSVRDGSLRLIRVDSESGSDILGSWSAKTFCYRPSATVLDIRATIRTYRERDLVLFGQEFVSGVFGSSVKDRFSVSSGFPSFYVGDETSRRDLGYLSYGGIMTGDTYLYLGKWRNTSLFDSGLDSGPLVLFDHDSDDAMVISSFSEFMAGSVVFAAQPGDGNMTATWGLLGAANEVPEGFSYWTAITYSNRGFNQLMEDWGQIMRTYYQKTRAFTESDFVNNYLGFWTDNGAYYYYITEGKMNYADTILAVKQYAEMVGIPYRYVQYDSWFYPKGPADGVTEWTSMDSIFPEGLQTMWNKTGWPVIAHNRWWSDKVRYAKQNGGKYNFIVEPKTKKALPLDEVFWEDLLRECKKWGLMTYEQDWLNVQFDQMRATGQSLTLGRQWLHQMGKGAAKNGLTIQYCMSPTRHALTSLEIPVVTQIRVSFDYHPGQKNWQIGISSILAHALGLAPYKDNFWSTEFQPGNPYGATEPHSALHALISTLSTGPVGPSDRIGYSDVPLIMRSCNNDGLLLKPDRPAMAIDKQIKQAAFSGFSGQVYSTYSSISGLQFGIVLGADFADGEWMTVSPSEAGFVTEGNSRLRQFAGGNPKTMREFNETEPIFLKSCSQSNFCLVYSTPVLTVGQSEVVLFGEIGKWVPMSSKRVQGIAVSSDGVRMSLLGAVQEIIQMVASVDGHLLYTDCIFGRTGEATLTLRPDTRDARCLST